MRIGSIAALLCVLGASLPPVAAAASTATRVFANFVPGNNGSFQGVLQDGAKTRQIAIYLENGTANYSNPACRVAGAVGDEVCAYDIKISIEGGGYITGFTGSTAMQWWPNSFPGPPNEVRSLGIAYVGVGSSVQETPQAMLIGTITVDGTPAGGTRVLVVGKQLVDAGFRPWTVPTATLATLPEPGLIASLCTGTLGIALLDRLRRARER